MGPEGPKTSPSNTPQDGGAVNKRLLKNAKIITLNESREVIEEGFLLLAGSKILDIGQGEYTVDPETTQVTDLRGSIVMPGLINSHNHSYANLVKGTAENLPLELWMLYTLVENKHMSKEDAYIGSLLGAVEMLKGGTIAFLDHQPHPLESLLESARAYKQAGIRVLLTPQFGNKAYGETLPETLKVASLPKPNRDVQPYLDMVTALIDSFPSYGARIRGGVGPSGPQRCSDSLLLASYELAEDRDVPWHTHVLETRAQAATAQNLYGKRMIEHLGELGVLSARCSLAHVVWVSEEEMQILADTRASIVHNPVSNLLLGSGILPLIDLREKGVRVALGTDGANCCGFQSMFEPIKLAAILSNVSTPDFSQWISAVEALEMSTNNGAQALGMDDEIGSLEVGKQADFIVINQRASALVPLNNLMWQIVYGRTDLFVSDVYVGGEKVVEEGRLLTVDEDAVYKEAESRGKWLMARLQADYERTKVDFPKIKEVLERM
jgi:5-methylthioadenosine/S-adenosylhomocysteine deaminase